jgi:hypothetical protein
VFVILGAVLWFLPLEFGTLGLLLAIATLVAILARGDTVARLRKTGAYLLGGGISGAAVLLADIIRIRNVCGTPGGQVQTSTGTSYACYSIGTLWFLLPYALLVCLGALLLFMAWRRAPAR